MLRSLLFLGFMTIVLAVRAGDRECPQDVAQWQNVATLSNSKQGARLVSSYANRYPHDDWQVFVVKNTICARRVIAKLEDQRERPAFPPAADHRRSPRHFRRVDDGWLVGFNDGEFGAALYWFSTDGKRHYKISNDQIVDFFSRSGGIYAIEGLDHMGMSSGSIIGISRPDQTAYWQVSTALHLPFAPYTISVRSDGTMFVALSDSLVSIGVENSINTLVTDVPWRGLYPQSSVLSPDEQKLYIGMRQFVVEVDIQTKKLRLLIPSEAYRNMLQKED